MNTPKYVVAPITLYQPSITAGRPYLVDQTCSTDKGGWIKDNRGADLCCHWAACAHLNQARWITLRDDEELAMFLLTFAYRYFDLEELEECPLCGNAPYLHKQSCAWVIWQNAVKELLQCE